MKSIWYKPFDLEYLNQRNKGTMGEFLGISFIRIGEDYLEATMPVNAQTKQPLGILHGGANVVLAETLASVAANAVLNRETHYAVGLEINANHIRSVSAGHVTGITRPLHVGRTTQVWLIDIVNEEGKLSCTSRMTAAVLSRT
ncbi:MAG: hotdog fold thioesterase [Gammaproteobacteria bacterium]|nr:hotdog fold thioesterase [Gammaproteobacteria bacterium]